MSYTIYTPAKLMGIQDLEDVIKEVVVSLSVYGLLNVEVTDIECTLLDRGVGREDKIAIEVVTKTIDQPCSAKKTKTTGIRTCTTDILKG